MLDAAGPKPDVVEPRLVQLSAGDEVGELQGSEVAQLVPEADGVLVHHDRPEEPLVELR